MFGATIAPGPSLPLAATFKDLQTQYFGSNENFHVTTVQDRDLELGVRQGQARAVKTIRSPIVHACARFSNAGNSGRLNLVFNPLINNVTSIYLDKIKITGIVGAHTLLSLRF